MKKCKGCCQEKSFEKFSKFKHSKNGKFYYNSYCLECNANRHNEWYKIGYNAKNKNNNKKIIWNKIPPEQRLFNSVKKRVLKKNIPFDINIDDIIIPEVCPILDIPLDFSTFDNTPQVDRIIPLKGYIKGNIQVISGRANRIKNDGTLAEHEAIVKYLKKHVQVAEWI